MDNKRILIFGSFVLLIVFSAFIFMGGFTGLSAQEEEQADFGYVDVDRIVNSHPAVQKAAEILEGEKDSLETQLEEKTDELSEEEYNELLNNINLHLRQLQTRLMEEVMESVEDDLTILLHNVGRESGVDMILKKENVLFGGIDLTSNVLQYIDEAKEEVLESPDILEDMDSE